LTFPVYNRGLTYHKVSEEREWGITTTTPRQFKAQIDRLDRLGFSFSTIRNSEKADNPILVTFDDGYNCVKEHALPVLDEYGGVGTVFAITGYVGKMNSWDYFPESKQIGHMDWSDLQALSQRGWEIGSHGLTHRRMIHMDRTTIQKELRNSKKELESRLGEEIVTFCPPFNAWNSELLYEVEQAGYKKMAISYPLNGLPSWSGEFVTRLGVYLHDPLPLFMGKITANPFSTLQVLQQQVINHLGDGRILENWLKR